MQKSEEIYFKIGNQSYLRNDLLFSSTVLYFLIKKNTDKQAIGRQSEFQILGFP